MVSRTPITLSAPFAATLLAVVVLLVGCGGGAKTSAIVARVGSGTISEAALEHWMLVLAPGHSVPDRSAQNARYDALKKRALSYLISSEWVLGAAAEQGGRPAAHPPASGGVSSKDTAFQSQVADAVRATRARLLAKSKESVEAELSTTYEEAGRLNVPERRDAEVIRTKTLAASMSAKREIMSGVPFADVANRVSVDSRGKGDGGLVSGIVRTQEDSVLKKAVFTAKLHSLTGPVMLKAGRYYLFEIIRIHPPQGVSAAQFAKSHAGRLIPRARAAALREWVESWTAKTSCHAGEVIAGCWQYAGPALPDSELPFSLD